MSCCSNKLLGNNNNVIKYYGSDLIAVEGANTVAKLPLGGIRIPYKQVLTSKIILQAGQVNYPLNVGLGDGVNILCVTAKYDPKSKIETNNYVQWNYFDDFSRMYEFSPILTLSGNSTHRVKQIYLHNPNVDYPVTIEVMTGVIDDAANFFSNTVVNQDVAFSNLKYTDIVTWVPGISIAILNSVNAITPLNGTPIVYIQLSNISSIERTGSLLIIDIISAGFIYLNFIDDFHAKQALSLIDWSNVSTNIIQDIDPRVDLLAPIIYFTSNVSLVGATISGPFNTDQGVYFDAATISLGTYSGTVSKFDILDYTIDYVFDYRGGLTGSTAVGDGLITLTYSNMIIVGTANTPLTYITVPGTYSMTFDLMDVATNAVNTSTYVLLNVTA